MVQKRAAEQHIAVFGESGSGKTSLLAAFYGQAQSSSEIAAHGYQLTISDPAKAKLLHQHYLQQRAGKQVTSLPVQQVEPYEFVLHPARNGHTGVRDASAALKLVWHDYPGKWLAPTVPANEQAARLAVIRSLLHSDVAMLVVDGAKLQTAAGNERQYLGKLFNDMAATLESLKAELLPKGKRLKVFPRVWVLALSKADLHPELNAEAFRDLVTMQAGIELANLSSVLQQFVHTKAAFSAFDDCLLLQLPQLPTSLSQVHYAPPKHLGLSAILPIAATVPLERKQRWLQYGQLDQKTAGQLQIGLKWAAGVAAGAAMTLATSGLGAAGAAGKAGLLLKAGKAVAGEAASKVSFDTVKQTVQKLKRNSRVKNVSESDAHPQGAIVPVTSETDGREIHLMGERMLERNKFLQQALADFKRVINAAEQQGVYLRG